MKSCNDCTLKGNCVTKIKMVTLVINDINLDRKTKPSSTDVLLRDYINGIANWCNRYTTIKQK